MTLRVAIVGRPNVGKSTLFNRLAGKKIAITDKSYGVTRDRLEAQGTLGDIDISVIDTAGFDHVTDTDLTTLVQEQTNQAIKSAQIALFLIDARSGLTPLDEYFAKWLRHQDTPIILAANKCEGSSRNLILYEAFKLGFGEPIAISAEHGDGIANLYEAILPFTENALQPSKPGKNTRSLNNIKESFSDETKHEVQLAVVGRPNVGKSTLINRLVGEDRVVTSPEAGVTRDSINIRCFFKGHTINLIDTAGLRKKSNVNTKLEKLSSDSTYRSIHYAQLVVLVLDASEKLGKQDLTIARQVFEEGRVLLVALNKWDIIKSKISTFNSLNERLRKSLPQLKGVPILKLSALNGNGVEKLLPMSLKYFKVWNQHIPTGPLNRWLFSVTERHPPPLNKGRSVRLRYITQAKTRPPTFVIFSSRGKSVPEDYRRYLVNTIREDFDLHGIPIRLVVRQGNNPYSEH